MVSSSRPSGRPPSPARSIRWSRSSRKRFLPQAQREPGVQAFQIHQSLTEPQKFFFYEVFKDAAAFGQHQQSDHFKTLIAEQALPKLAKRERTRRRFVPWTPEQVQNPEA